jgi:hypothetical protein
MSHSMRLALVAAVLVTGPVAQSPVRAAGVPADACTLLTPADYKAFGVTATPKGQLAATPVQTAHACTAGSVAVKPMLSLIVQEIKMPMAVEMARKALARDGDALTGPWDAGNVHAGVDGTQVRFFKGSVSVQLLTSATDAAAKTTLVAIARRVGAAL